MYVLAFSPGINNITSVVLLHIKKYYHLSNPYYFAIPYKGAPHTLTPTRVSLYSSNSSNLSHLPDLVTFFIIVTFLSFLYFVYLIKVNKPKKQLK